MTRPRRGGAALLEVIAAMTLLMVAGVSGVALVSQVKQAVAHAQETDRRVSEASQAMDRISLWSRHRLLSAVGQSAWQRMVLDVSQPSPVLFQVRLQEQVTRADIVTSIVYRP